MDSSIIFEKKYSQFIQECLDDAQAADAVTSAAELIGDNSSEYVRNLLGNSVCVLIPERMEKSRYFIDLAKEIAEAYLIDIVIKKHHDRITATYTLDFDAGFSSLKPIIQLADELSFQNGKNCVLISLDYHTHAMYRSGNIMCP